MGDISVSRVAKFFGGADPASRVLALDDVSIEIPTGQFLCIIGPSGCGKTTLLHTIAGFERPSRGQALIDGRAISGPGPDRIVIFQEYGLYPWMTVAQNVEFGLRAKGLNARRRGEIVRHFINLVRLNGFEDRYPHEISGGMKQRVSIARALAPEPAVVLMDEPFAALDSLTRDVLQEEILRIWGVTRQTFVLITHNVDEAIFLGDRVMVMTARPGRVKAVLDVDIPRPRDPAVRTHDPRFLAIKDELSAHLRAEVSLAAA
ncbi:ABC transporter ATP-binding protein [Hansschlegelia sp. KR7-227]|uniref:ABC transporter ATP-binding protein n=1 Tax=Hansschlegelia sp. KR7-227 TaxID=3400914 RepID=UPI003C0BAA41